MMGQANVFKDIHAKELVLSGEASAAALTIKNALGNSVLVLEVSASRGKLVLKDSLGVTKTIIDGNADNSYIGTSLAVGQSGAADASAIIEAESTTRGFLPPRMTEAQRDAINAPAAGLIIYNSTTNKLNVRAAAAWEIVTSI